MDWKVERKLLVFRNLIGFIQLFNQSYNQHQNIKLKSLHNVYGFDFSIN